jgi:TolB-like protein/DNA-binding winged helix-turn-helix (wHTH) protein/tetratricopeptide (TPR) repeat protein
MKASPRVRFGVFEFDLASGELRRDGHRIPLQIQPAQLLARLVSAPGEVVTRDELRRAIWAEDTFVDFDAALNVAINKIRHALRDSATVPRFVETLPRRGYRFLADVHPADDEPVPASPPTAPTVPPEPVALRRHAHRAWFAGLAVALVLLAVWSGTRSRQPSASTPSLAVLPFRPLVADMPDEALQVALAEAVIVKLGELRQLRVPSIHAVKRYAESDTDARIAGRELRVDAVLEGTLLRRDGAVRLSARLIDVSEGTSLWSGQWDVPWTDIFTVQDTIAKEVTGALAVRLGAEEQERLHRHPTNLAAYEAYLRARSLMLRLTAADSRRAIERLEEAIELDPGSAPAHATLAFAYIMVGITEGPREPHATLARQAAYRARELDGTLAEAYGSLGRILFHFDWNAESGLEHMQRALALEPSNPFVLHCASRLFADSGRIAESLALTERALALDPASALANYDKVVNLVRARRYEQAIAQAQKALELDPYSVMTYKYLGEAYELLHRETEAIDAYIKPLTFSEEHRRTVELLRAAGQRDGLRGFYEQTLALLLEGDPARPEELARVHLKLGQHDRALEWLDRLHAERWPWMLALKHDPDWDVVRDHPRFRRLMALVEQQAARGTARLGSRPH